MIITPPTKLVSNRSSFAPFPIKKKAAFCGFFIALAFGKQDQKNNAGPAGKQDRILLQKKA